VPTALAARPGMGGVLLGFYRCAGTPAPCCATPSMSQPSSCSVCRERIPARLSLPGSLLLPVLFWPVLPATDRRLCPSVFGIELASMRRAFFHQCDPGKEPVTLNSSPSGMHKRFLGLGNEVAVSWAAVYRLPG
jgi:hypothetical protein